MNAYVYGYGEPGRERADRRRSGVTFGDMDSAPGIDLIMADMAWLEANRPDRRHLHHPRAWHEDHVGALLACCGRSCKSRCIAGVSPARWLLKLEEAASPPTSDPCPAPPTSCRPVPSGAVRADQPLDPRKLGADHRYACRADRPYRRLQAGRVARGGRGVPTRSCGTRSPMKGGGSRC